MRASIVIPAYNAARYISDTLDSVLSQCDERMEVILVDDGSTDNTVQCVARYGERIKLICQSNSGGPSAPRNIAIEAARGEIVFFFDADDLMLPGKISTTLTVFDQEPTISLVFTNFRTIDETGIVQQDRFLSTYEAIEKLEKQSCGYHVLTSEFVSRLISGNFIGTSGVAVRRSVLAQVGVFNPKFYCGEDWDLWLRIARRHAIAYLPEVLHSYRRHSGSITASDSLRLIHSQVLMLREHLNSTTTEDHRAKLIQVIGERCFSIAYVFYKRSDAAQALFWLSQVDGAVSFSRYAWLNIKIRVWVQFFGTLRAIVQLPFAKANNKL